VTSGRQKNPDNIARGKNEIFFLVNLLTRKKGNEKRTKRKLMVKTKTIGGKKKGGLSIKFCMPQEESGDVFWEKKTKERRRSFEERSSLGAKERLLLKRRLEGGRKTGDTSGHPSSFTA